MLKSRAARQRSIRKATLSFCLTPFAVLLLWFTIQPSMAQTEACPPGIRVVATSPCPGWTFVENQEGARVRVWFKRPEDRQNAIAVKDELENVIWDKLSAYMGKQPKPDGDFDPLFNGGSGQLDVIFHNPVKENPENPAAVEKPSPGQTIVYDGKFVTSTSHDQCKLPSATYIMVNQNMMGDEATRKATLAHEFMHVLQFAFPLKGCTRDWTWLTESTATWAIDFVYHTLVDASGKQFEHQFVGDYLASTNRALPLPLSDDPNKDPGNDMRIRGTYLFWQYLTDRHNSAAVRQTFKATEPFFAPATDQIAALTSVIEGIGGFPKIWPAFALEAWNQEPVPGLQLRDDLSQGARTEGSPPNGPNVKQTMRLTAKAAETLNLPFNVAPLGIQYFHIEFPDNSARSVIFDHLALPESTHVWAIMRMAGKTNWEREEDWSERLVSFLPHRRAQFCRDRADQRVAELVLIFSNDNSVVTDPAAKSLMTRVRGSSFGCWRLHVSELLGERTIHNTFTGHTGVETLTGKDLVFEREESALGLLGDDNFHVVGAPLFTWTYSGSIDGCKAGPITLTFSGANSWIHIDHLEDPNTLEEDPNTGHMLIDMRIPSEDLPHPPHKCPDGFSTSAPVLGSFVMNIDHPDIQPDGTLKGVSIKPTEYWTNTLGWLITPLRQ